MDKVAMQSPPTGAAALTTGGATRSHRPPFAVTRYLAVGDGRIAYDDTGGAGPLVLGIPGMGDLRSQFRHLRPALVAAGYRVITMDVRGFGETTARWIDYSAHAIAGDALQLIEQLDAGPAVILGNSFAAGSALWAAHDAPTQVRGVVLLGPIIRDAPLSILAKATFKLGFSGPWRVWFWMTYWDSLFPTHKPQDHIKTRSALARNLHEPGRMEALRAMVYTSKADTEAMLGNSHIPALVVMGTLDPDFPDAAAEARWLSKRLRTSSLIVEGAGHYPHTEMPEQVAPPVLSFIAGLAVAGSPARRRL